MPHFGNRSKRNLSQCDHKLQDLFNEVIKHYDCAVICGHRTEEKQNEAFANGRSKKRFPDSKHNSMPSTAADVVPYPVNWLDIDGFKEFMEFVKETAKKMGIKIRCGGDWKDPVDYPHYELEK